MKIYCGITCPTLQCALIFPVIHKTFCPEKEVHVGTVHIWPLNRQNFLSALSSGNKAEQSYYKNIKTFDVMLWRCPLTTACAKLLFPLSGNRAKKCCNFTLENSHAYLLALEERADTSRQHLRSASLLCIWKQVFYTQPISTQRCSSL